MDRRQVGAKPFLEPKLTSHRENATEQYYVKLVSNLTHFIEEKWNEIVVCAYQISPGLNELNQEIRLHQYGTETIVLNMTRNLMFRNHWGREVQYYKNIYIINTLSISVCLYVCTFANSSETIGVRDLKCWKMLENIPGVFFYLYFDYFFVFQKQTFPYKSLITV